MLRKLLIGAAILSPFLAHAQTPTLQQDIDILGQQAATLNNNITQLSSLPKSSKTLQTIIASLNSVSVALGTLGTNLAALSSSSSTPLLPSPTVSCVGTPIVAPTVGALIMPPSVPQPGSGNLIGAIIQNTATSQHNSFVFGQVFKQGSLNPTTDGVSVVTTVDGLARPSQLDTISTWPDGTVELGAIYVNVPICAKAQSPIMLSKVVKPVGTPPSLSDLTLTATFTFTSGYYTGTQTVDLGTPLANSTYFWLRGPQITEARVDVPVPGGSPSTLHVIADVRKNAVGNLLYDVQVNNDLTTLGNAVNPSVLPALAYTVVITYSWGGGTAQWSKSIPAHYQYQDWHTVIGEVAPLQFNVQHDAAYLEATGAVLKYDLTTGVQNGQQPPGSIWPNNVFDDAASVAAAVGFGTPLNSNGVDKYMPDVGGRHDIGWTTAYDTAWLLTGDPRMATMGLVWGDTAGAVPWNYRSATTGHWFTTQDNPNIWIDYRSSVMLANSPDTANSGWTPERAHAPNLAYIPYIMTASRWYLDRLNAQAAFAVTTMSNDATYGRCAAATCDIELTLSGQQVRGMAWSMREIGEAAFVGKTGSWEQSYFQGVRDHNWVYAQSVQPGLVTAEGEAAGWWVRISEPCANCDALGWENDYLTGVASLLAGVGDVGAKQFVQWQHGWLTGRFIASDMNPRDGCTYALTAYDASAVPLKTWTAIETATVAFGLSQGTSGPWPNGNGDYCSIARGVLGAALAVTPNDPGLMQALAWLNTNGPYSVGKLYFQQDPTFNVVP